MSKGKSYKKFSLLIMVLCLALVVAACGGGNKGGNNNNNTTTPPASNGSNNETPGSTDEPVAEPDPITLKMTTVYDEDYFETTFRPVIEEKLPWITIDYFPEGNIVELIAANDVPDIWFVSGHVVNGAIIGNGMAFDLNPLIEKHNFDMSRINQSMMSYYNSQLSEEYEGQILGMPFRGSGLAALYYNKDIFDAFNVDYPTDGMTWREVVDLAKQVTGTRDGVEYAGLDLDMTNIIQDQMGQPAIDENGEITFLRTDKYPRILELAREVADIPGNWPSDDGHPVMSYGGRFAEGHVAMRTGRDFTSRLITHFEPSFEWDLVTYPVWDDMPGIGPAVAPDYLAISPYSSPDAQDAAFQVIMAMLSDEVQLKLAGLGQLTAIDTPEVVEQFHSDTPGIENYNIEALFKNTPQPVPPLAPAGYPGDVRLIHGHINDFLDSNQDPQSFLRDLEEAGYIRIEEFRAQQ